MKFGNLVLCFLSILFLTSCSNQPTIQGELKTWHKVTILFDGPQTSELAEINPFTDYRLDVTFTNGAKEYVVPGHFAADGEAAYTSAKVGNKWRVHFTPDTSGTWQYRVSFTKGTDIAMSSQVGEGAGFMDGLVGSFEIHPSDKPDEDLRSKGKLQYVGEHYPQFTGTREYFIKCGPDAPENLLAYYEFDDTPNVGNRLKRWDDHGQDYDTDADPFLWGVQQDKGKNLLGAINYLAEKGMNAFSFLTFNVDGDDRNVFPHLLKVSQDQCEAEANIKDSTNLWEKAVIHDRFDVSKMDQWEQVFAYGELKGMFLHFKTQETENDHKMDGGELGRERKLYYRELISRYGHHLAMNWNLGEENTQSTEQVQAMAQFFEENDPYQTPVVLHTYPGQHEKVYRPLIGDKSKIDGLSIQTKKADFRLVHDAVKKWTQASASEGKKWMVAVDEPGDAGHALLPDSEDPDHDDARINALWGTLLAGGWGTEWYFGYKHDHSDLTCESWRSRDLFWDQCKVALEIFDAFDFPILEMQSIDSLTQSEDDFVFAKPAESYLIYSKNGGEIEIHSEVQNFQYQLIDPKTGEHLSKGNVTENQLVLETPPGRDCLVILRKASKN